MWRVNCSVETGLVGVNNWERPDSQKKRVAKARLTKPRLANKKNDSQQKRLATRLTRNTTARTKTESQNPTRKKEKPMNSVVKILGRMVIILIPNFRHHILRLIVFFASRLFESVFCESLCLRVGFFRVGFLRAVFFASGFCESFLLRVVVFASRVFASRLLCEAGFLRAVFVWGRVFASLFFLRVGFCESGSCRIMLNRDGGQIVRIRRFGSVDPRTTNPESGPFREWVKFVSNLSPTGSDRKPPDPSLQIRRSNNNGSGILTLSGMGQIYVKLVATGGLAENVRIRRSGSVAPRTTHPGSGVLGRPFGVGISEDAPTDNLWIPKISGLRVLGGLG